MRPMICGSCRRRCDPKRSFCTHCGSAVFIDRATSGRSLPTGAACGVIVRAVPSELLRSIQRSAQSLHRRRSRARPQASERAARARAAALRRSPLGPLIRFGIFVFIALVRGVLAVEDSRSDSAEGPRARRDISATRICRRRKTRSPTPANLPAQSQDPNPPSAVESAEKNAEATARRGRARPVGSADPAAVASPPETDSLPPGVSLPGDGVSMPRVRAQGES
jgi:hypothetical protein